MSFKNTFFIMNMSLRYRNICHNLSIYFRISLSSVSPFIEDISVCICIGVIFRIDMHHIHIYMHSSHNNIMSTPFLLFIKLFFPFYFFKLLYNVVLLCQIIGSIIYHSNRFFYEVYNHIVSCFFFVC